MLLFGDFDSLPLTLRLSSWGLVRRFSDGFPDERESWFAWVQRKVLLSLTGEEQKELRVMAYFPEWAFCMRRSIMRLTELPDTAGPEFEFYTTTPQQLLFKDRKLVPPAPATEPPAEPAKPKAVAEGNWQWVEPEGKPPAASTQSKASKAGTVALATDTAPTESLS